MPPARALTLLLAAFPTRAAAEAARPDIEAALGRAFFTPQERELLAKKSERGLPADVQKGEGGTRSGFKKHARERTGRDDRLRVVLVLVTVRGGRGVGVAHKERRALLQEEGTRRGDQCRI